MVALFMHPLVSSSKHKLPCSTFFDTLNVFYFLTDKLGVSGRWFRHKLLDGIMVGTPVLLTIQRHRTGLRTTIMKTLSFLGTEDFYTILFVFLLWYVLWCMIFENTLKYFTCQQTRNPC